MNSARVCGASSVLLGLLALSVTGCGAGGGSAGSPPTTEAAAPSVSLTASANAVTPGSTTTLTWTSSRAGNCSASGAWSGARPTSGQETVGPLSEASTFNLQCSGTGGTGSGSLTVAVTAGTAQLATGVVVLDVAATDRIASASDTQVTFTGNAPVSPGQVFVARETAYKAISVQESGGQTIVATVTPSIEDLVDRLQLSGRVAADTSQLVIDANAAQAGALLDTSLVSQSMVLPINISGSGLSVKGTETLTFEAAFDIDYDKAQGGYRQLAFSTTLSSTLAATLSAKASVKADPVRIGFLRIPIPLTIADRVLSALGVTVVSIYVPLLIGVDASVGAEISAAETIATSATIGVTATREGVVTPMTSFANTHGEPGTIAPVPASIGSPSLTAAVSMFLETKPSIAVLNSVALVGYARRLGGRLDATITPVPSQSPFYCTDAKLAVFTEGEFFIKALGGIDVTVGETSSDIWSGGPFKAGACEVAPPGIKVFQIFGINDSELVNLCAISTPIPITVTETSSSQPSSQTTQTWNVPLFRVDGNANSRVNYVPLVCQIGAREWVPKSALFVQEVPVGIGSATPTGVNADTYRSRFDLDASGMITAAREADSFRNYTQQLAPNDQQSVKYEGHYHNGIMLSLADGSGAHSLTDRLDIVTTRQGTTTTYWSNRVGDGAWGPQTDLSQELVLSLVKTLPAGSPIPPECSAP